MKTGSPTDRYCPICRSENIAHWGVGVDIGNPALKHDLVKCRQCTHLFVHPLPSEEYLKKVYKEGDPSVYTANRFFESRSNNPFSRADKWVWKNVLRSTSPGRFLDVGSANSRLLEQITGLGWRLSVVEPSAHAENIRKKIHSTVYREILEDSHFPHRFDMVSAMDVLEHVHSPVRFLRKIRSCLSNKGISLLRFPNSGSLRCRMESENWNMIRPLGHLHYFSPRSIRRACQISRLKIISLRSHDLARYRYIAFPKRDIRGWRFLSPFFYVFDLALLGDQLLVKVTNG